MLEKGQRHHRSNTNGAKRRRESKRPVNRKRCAMLRGLAEVQYQEYLSALQQWIIPEKRCVEIKHDATSGRSSSAK